MMYLIKLDLSVCHTNSFRCSIEPLESNSCNIDKQNNLSGRDKTGHALASKYAGAKPIYLYVTKRLVREELGGESVWYFLPLSVRDIHICVIFHF